MKVKTIWLITLLILCTNVFAASDSNVTVTALGVQGNNMYVYTSPAPTGGCLYNVIYLDITTDFGKTAYAAVLVAKMKAKPLTRIDYDKAASGVCTLTLVEM